MCSEKGLTARFTFHQRKRNTTTAKRFHEENPNPPRTVTQHPKPQLETVGWSIWLPPPPSETLINPQNSKPRVKVVV